MNTDYKMKLLLSDARGIYIPRDFALSWNPETWGLTQDDIEALTEYNNEWYWEQWEIVLNKAKHTDKDGFVWTLYQDGDLWAIRSDFTEQEWSERFGN